MKKLIVMALALVALFSCKKEMIEQQTKTDLAQPQLSVGTLLDYEYFTPGGDVETEIRAALLALENDENLGYTSINRGVWLLETGISYLIQDQDYAYLDFSSDTNMYTLSLNDLGEVSEVDLKSTVIALHEDIVTVTSESVKHVATDIKVLEITDNDITLIALTTLLTGVNQVGAYNCNVHHGPPFNDITWNQEAKNKMYCAGSSGFYGQFTSSTAATVCANETRPALRCLTAAQNRFYTQAISFSSVGFGLGSNASISAQNLLGQTNSPISSHQNWVPVNECVFANELNTYSTIMYDDIKQLMGKSNNFIGLSMTYSQASLPDPNNPNVNIWHCKFEYLTVTTGKSIFPQYTGGITLSYL
jgi:hypothetical protein